MFENRRPLSTRKVSFFQNLAKTLVSWKLTPNRVSLYSIVFASFGAFSFHQLANLNFDFQYYKFYFWSLMAILGIQMRLLCNLMDGLMAIEGGLKTANGEIFNDVPDRFSDIILLFAASLNIPFAWGSSLGWLAAIMAVLTAYVRVLGGSLGLKQDFSGPLAKQHRMFVLTLCVLVSIFEKIWTESVVYSYALGLAFIAAGSALTFYLRLNKISNQLLE